MAKDSAQALHEFWSWFGWKAYDSATVPSKDKDSQPIIPRITYDVAEDEFEYPLILHASLWDRSYTWDDISQKAKEIYNAIGLGGIRIKYDDGMIWLKRGHPFSQRMADEDDAIRRILLSIEAEYFTSK